MNTTSAEGLLPCPFCGSDAAFNTSRTSVRSFIRLNGRDTGYGVNCVSCGVNNRGIAIGYATKEQASAAWNRRAASPAEGRMGDRERLVRAIESEKSEWVGDYRKPAHRALDDLLRKYDSLPPADSPATLGEDVADEHAVFVEHCADKLEKHGYPSTARALRETAGFLRALAKKPEDERNRLLCWAFDNLNDMPVSDEWAAEWCRQAEPFVLSGHPTITTPPEVGGGRGE